jgi:hypothetical protein
MVYGVCRMQRACRIGACWGFMERKEGGQVSRVRSTLVCIYIQYIRE